MHRLLAPIAAGLVALAAAGPSRADDAVRYRPGPAGMPANPCDPCAPCTPCAPPRDPCDPRCDVRRGPIEVRDMYVLAQPRLTLPAMSPDTLGCGRSSVRLQFHWSNSFGWRQDVTGENPGIRYFLVDGETRTLDATFMHGVTGALDLGVRVPYHWRGPGVLDEVIDAFHNSIPGLFKDNKRKDFDNDRYRVNGLLEDGSPFDADDETGAGLGNVEGIARWRFVDGGRDGLSMAAVGRVTAPTGSAPFDTDGVEAGLQLVAAHRLSARWDLFGGIGETWYEEPTYQGIRYAEWRTSLFVAAEWRFASWASLLLQLDYTGPLAADVQNFAPDQLYTQVGVKADVAPGTRVEIGFTENIVNQQTTADFGMWFGLEHVW